MIGSKVIKCDINGIYGRVKHSDLALNKEGKDEYYKSRHFYTEEDLNTFKTINKNEEESGLPLGITQDEYFKMALIQAIHSINKDATNKGLYEIQNQLEKLNSNIEKITESIVRMDMMNVSKSNKK